MNKTRRQTEEQQEDTTRTTTTTIAFLLLLIIIEEENSLDTTTNLSKFPKQGINYHENSYQIRKKAARKKITGNSYIFC